MTYFTEQRRYQRCNNLVCKILMSTDGKAWNEIELYDISAGGLKFLTEDTYEIDTKVSFHLYIYNMLSEFSLRIEGQLIRAERNRGKNAYGVQFINFDKYHQIQLDELIKSRISITDNPVSLYHDEVYTFVLAPNFGRSKSKTVK